MSTANASLIHSHANVDATNHQFHQASRAHLTERVQEAGVCEGYGPRSIEVRTVIDHILGFAGADAHGERRAYIYEQLAEMSTLRTPTDYLCCATLEVNGAVWELSLKTHYHAPTGIAGITRTYDLVAYKMFHALNPCGTCKMSNKQLLIPQIQGAAIQAPTWRSQSLWALADNLPAFLDSRLHCRACGQRMGETDLCIVCRGVLWTTPCDVCSSLVGKRTSKRRCVAHGDWEGALNEYSDDDE